MTSVRVTALCESFGKCVEGVRADSWGSDVSHFVEALRDCGALLFRRCAPTIDAFCRFTQRFNVHFRAHPNAEQYSERYQDDLTVQIMPHRAGIDIPLHNELAYSGVEPDVVWFYCERPASSGGEASICDGTQLLSTFSEDTRRLLGLTEFLYRRRNIPREAWERLYGLKSLAETRELLSQIPRMSFAFGPDDSLTIEYRDSAIRNLSTGDAFANASFVAPDVSLVSEESIPEGFLKTLQSVAEQVSFDHPWSAGDVLMIDNHRVMHGLRPHHDSRRRLVSRVCDFV